MLHCLAFAFRVHNLAVMLERLRQDDVSITTEQLVRFHIHKFDEMLRKLGRLFLKLYQRRILPMGSSYD